MKISNSLIKTGELVFLLKLFWVGLPRGFNYIQKFVKINLKKCKISLNKNKQITEMKKTYVIKQNKE